MSHDDFATEPVPGLPAHLPEGEHIIWQGAPDPAAFARHVLHSRKVVFYFAILALWNFSTALYDGGSVANGIVDASFMVLAAAAVLAIIWFYARAVSRTTVYTLTNRRVLMRFGVALPVTFNYPFAQISGANIKQFSGDFGNITLELAEHSKVSWAVLWPHARPWKLSQPEPAMRAIGDLGNVASLVSRELHAFHDKPVPATNIEMQEQADAPVKTKPLPARLSNQGA